jgi:hypothetical protein
MAYNVNALVDYTNEQNFPILKASVMGSKTASLFQIQTGIKSTSALNIMNVDVTLQNDSVGSDTEGGGNVTFSQRMLSVAPIAVREFFDPKVLNAKFIQSQIKLGSEDNEIVFEQEIVDQVTALVASKNEKALWAGDVTLSGSTDLKHFDGYLKLIDAEADVVSVTGSTLTSANVMAIVDEVYDNIPVAVLDTEDMGIYMGRDTYRLYTTALKNANLFHYNVEGGEEFSVPGTTIKVYALNGLNGSDRIVAGRKSNFFIGLDLEGEEDNARTVYIDQIERVKMKISYKLGAQIAFPQEIVEFHTA